MREHLGDNERRAEDSLCRAGSDVKMSRQRALRDSCMQRRRKSHSLKFVAHFSRRPMSPSRPAAFAHYSIYLGFIGAIFAICLLYERLYSRKRQKA